MDWATSTYPHMYSDNTVKGYRNLARRLEAWCQQQQPQQDPWNQTAMAAFVASTQARPSGQLSYNKVMTAILALREKILQTPLALARRNLTGAGALVPHHQAPPISKHQLLEIPELRPHRLALLIAWKSASRWDEVAKLTRANITTLPATENLPMEVHVDWFRGTKMSRTDPFRASRYTVISGDNTEEIAMMLQLLPEQSPITTLTTSALDKLLLPHHFSAHSIKAGAIDTVTKALPPGLESEKLIARLAKHKHFADPESTTLRYVRDPAALARLLGTAAATRLL